MPRPGIEPGPEVPETSVMSFSLPGRAVRQLTSTLASRGEQGDAALIDAAGARQHGRYGDHRHFRFGAAPARAVQGWLESFGAYPAASALQHQSLRADALDVRSDSDC